MRVDVNFMARYPVASRTFILYPVDIRHKPSYLEPYHYHACWCQLYGDWKCLALLKPRYPVYGTIYGRTYIRYPADIRTEPSYLEPYHYHACWCQLYDDWKCPALLKPRYPVFRPDIYLVSDRDNQISTVTYYLCSFIPYLRWGHYLNDLNLRVNANLIKRSSRRKTFVLTQG